MDNRVLEIHEEDLQDFKRLDQLLAAKFSDLSRTFLKSLYEKGLIQNPEGIKLELKKVPPVGTVIEIEIPPPTDATAIAQDIPLEILFEDEHLIVINKKPGMVVHPAPGHPDGTLVNAILHHCQDLKGVGDQKRPGIVHRLDKGTSGVMVVAKNQKCHEGLVLLFSKHDITRRYHALAVKKELPVGGTLKSTIGRHPSQRQRQEINVRNGKEATTHYRVLETFPMISLVECTLETGRTHQIRVHLTKLLNAPILNDYQYGSPSRDRNIFSFSELFKDYEHPFLHAKELGFIHPITKEELHFESEYSEAFSKVLNELRENP